MTKKNMLKADDQPWIENYPPLLAWLNKHGATCVSQVRDGNSMIEIWLFHKSQRLAVITVKPNRRGWDIWTACDTNKIDATFVDAEERLGLTPEYLGDVSPPHGDHE